MAKWKCPVPGCDKWVLAPDVRPIHAHAPNPAFQAKDPHCPDHLVDLIWTADATAPSLLQPEVAASTEELGSVHKKLGILATRFQNHSVYCDYHQRKHVSGGNWPGGTPTDKPLFLPDIYNQKNLRLCKYLADSVPWGNFRTVVGGVDVIFDCGITVVGTANETHILLQGGFQKEGSVMVITFHAYPIEEEGPRVATFKSCRAKERFIVLTEVAKYTSASEEKEGKGGKGKKAKE